MKLTITPGKKRLALYALIVGGLAILGLVFFGISQYEKAKYKSSSIVLTGATSQISLLQNEEKTKLVKDKLEWYQDIEDHFKVVNKKNANAYKGTALPAYFFTTGALVAFGLCLKHEDKVKEKEEEDDK